MMFFRLLILLSSLFLLAHCSSGSRNNAVIVSVADQTMLLVRKGKPLKVYPVSTSKFGLGNRAGSKKTPLGVMQVAKKIGNGAPVGAVFKHRSRTGEVLKPNTPGRDPIVTRILWLKGTQRGNANTFRRLIYIHGTPEEYRLGTPASYGCIRMRSRHVIDLYRYLSVGSEVKVIRGSLLDTQEGQIYAAHNEELMRPAAGN